MPNRIANLRIGTPFSGDNAPAVRYYLEDHLGNCSFTLETTGTLFSREEYFPFGETSFGSFAKKRYRFCGKERDEESGLYYYGARYYAAWTCRFVSVDPLAGEYPFYTPYQYAGNQPVNSVDLDGLETNPSTSTSPQGNLSEMIENDGKINSDNLTTIPIIDQNKAQAQIPFELIDLNGNLTTPMIILLNSTFNYSISSLENTRWETYYYSPQNLDWWGIVNFKGTTQASCKGKTVVHDGDPNRGDFGWFDLIVHEQSHRHEIDFLGWVQFYGQYLAEGIEKEYEKISSEETAYSRGGRSFSYSKALWKYQNGIVQSTLFDPNLSEDTKIKTLEAVGSKFRRDFIIPDQMKANESLISQLITELGSSKGLGKNEQLEKTKRIELLLTANRVLLQEKISLFKKYGQ